MVSTCVALSATAHGQSSPEDPPAELLRGLPLCAEDRPPPAAGEYFTCRPPIDDAGLHFTVRANASLGWSDAEQPLRHSGFAAGVDMTVWLNRNLGLTAGYRFWSSPSAETSNDRPSAPLRLHLPELSITARTYTDEAAREGFRFAVSLGPVFGTRHGGLIATEVVREFGTYRGLTRAIGAHVGLRYLQGFATARDVRGLLLVAGFDVERGIPSPANLDRPASLSRIPYTIGVELVAVGRYFALPGLDGYATGVGFNLGFPRHAVLEPRIHADLQFTKSGEMTVATTAGLRLRFNRWIPIYTDFGIGYGTGFGDAAPALRGGIIADVGLALRFGTCPSAGDIGVRYRRGIGAQNQNLDALMLVAGVEYGSQAGTLGGAPLRAERCRPAPPAPRVRASDSEELESGADGRVPTSQTSEGHVEVESTGSTTRVLTVPLSMARRGLGIPLDSLRNAISVGHSTPLRLKLRSRAAERAHLESAVRSAFREASIEIESIAHQEISGSPDLIIYLTP